MELSQTVKVDSAVVHPDALQQAGSSGCSLAKKYDLVDQIDYVAHIREVGFRHSAAALTTNGSSELAPPATSSTQPEAPLATHVNT